MKPSSWAFVAAVLGAAYWPAWAQGNGTVYRCPGPPILYTDTLSPAEAKEKNCRTIEGAPVTVMQTVKPRPLPGVRPEGSKVDPADQKARDNDRRQILADELKKEEDSLSALRKEYAFWAFVGPALEIDADRTLRGAHRRRRAQDQNAVIAPLDLDALRKRRLGQSIHAGLLDSVPPGARRPQPAAAFCSTISS